MKIYLIIFFILTLSLSARENPFEPVKQEFNEIKIPPKTKPIPVQIKIEEQIPIVKTIPIIKPEPKIEIPIAPKIIKPKPIQKKHKRYKRPKTPKFIYRGEFTKISLHKNAIKIVTKDKMLKHFKLKSPNRIVIDFERFDVVEPFSKTIDAVRVKGLRVGHHDYFYRVSFKLNKSYNYKISKKPYGYLISF